MGCMWITCIMHEENSSTRALSQNSANLKKGGGCHFFPFLNSSKFVTGKSRLLFSQKPVIFLLKLPSPWRPFNSTIVFYQTKKKKKTNSTYCFIWWSGPLIWWVLCWKIFTTHLGQWLEYVLHMLFPSHSSGGPLYGLIATKFYFIANLHNGHQINGLDCNITSSVWWTRWRYQLPLTFSWSS